MAMFADLFLGRFVAGAIKERYQLRCGKQTVAGVG